MAALPVTLDGVLYDLYGRTTQRVIFIGDASLTGVGVGGGPVVPPPGGPVHIWGPPDPRPQPPIAFPPGWVGGVPPGQPGGPVHIWGGGNVPMPSPPIANVPGAPGFQPPDKPPEPVQPPIDWKAVWHPTEGWIVVGIPNVPHPTPST